MPTPASRRDWLCGLVAGAAGMLLAGETTSWAIEASATAVPEGAKPPQDQLAPGKIVDGGPTASHEHLIPRIWNLSNKPFAFRFSRRRGPPWTQSYTIAPQKYFLLNNSVPDADDIEGLHLAAGRALIQYPDYCGLMHFNLNVGIEEAVEAVFRKYFSGESEPKTGSLLMPYLFVIADHDGHFHLLQSQVVPTREPGKGLRQGKRIDPLDAVQSAIDRAREVQASLHVADADARNDALKKIVGEPHVDVNRRIRTYQTNHVLICPPGPPVVPGRVYVGLPSCPVIP